MKWFKHEATANMDAKLQEVLLDYGLEGYGLYWYCLELIAGNVEADKLTFELEHDARIIARNTGSSVQRVEEMMGRFASLGLFESANGVITCLKLAKVSDDYTSKMVRLKGTQVIDSKEVLQSPTNSEKDPLDKTRLDKIKQDKEPAKAEKKLTKAELLFNKVRLNKDKYPELNLVCDELLTEWSKLRCKKGASDSERALLRIESTLYELKYSHDIHPGWAISKQCDAGWTSVEVDYFVKGNSNTGQQVALPSKSLDEELRRAF
ncbi:MAG: DUF4373 domain-containing protein [Colwellia sp.]|nr:DUF4373 domain-containing protein [Colwellia sp.]